ncbi:MAG: aminoacetone oxidase family FAD-binding enzyme [Gordonibacter sp.]
MKKLAIIGGGAAGLAAAVAAGEALRSPGGSNVSHDVEVVLYETDERVGRSILATGNGRCNFSNAHIDAGLYRNGAFVRDALIALRGRSARRDSATAASCDENPVHEFFADWGLEWREEGEGRLYPLANKASVVLDVLREACAAGGVREACGSAVVSVVPPERTGEHFHLRFADGAIEHADAVVVACGGRGFAGLLPERYRVASARPVLGPLRTAGSVAKSLDNIRVRAALTLVDAGGTLRAREEGELLFRSYGVSGIAVFNLSRHASPGDRLLVDLLPFVAEADCESYLFRRRKRMTAHVGELSGEGFLRGLLLPPVSRVVLREAGLRSEALFSKTDVPVLARSLKTLPFVVEGVGDARQCQVTRGGFSVGDFDATTMESHLDKGLYVVGEALDVDAPCGGYNLHWAWASGLTAGRAAAVQLAG